MDAESVAECGGVLEELRKIMVDILMNTIYNMVVQYLENHNHRSNYFPRAGQGIAQYSIPPGTILYG